MFWIGVAVSVGLIVILTWIGAAMTGRGPGRTNDGGPWIPGDYGDDHWR